MDIRSTALRKLDEQIEKLRAKRSAVILTKQLACNHKALKPGEYGVNDELFRTRICLKCGMTETEHCGYKVIKGEYPVKLTNRELQQMRLGLQINDEMKGPLLRGETSVNDQLKLLLNA
jgi:hypothetical protein